MATPNPHFDPEWRALRDRHDEERSCAGDELRRLCEAGEAGSKAYEAAKAAWEHHDKAWKGTFRKQFATVEKYAAWLFDAFPAGQGLGAGVPVPQLDLTSVGTVEEVDAAWSRIEGWVTDSADEMRGSLPIGQPEGLQAFADPDSPKLVRYWRHFRARDLYPAGAAGELGVFSLVTIDEQDDGWHICFTQDGDPESGSVTNAIEHLATGVYREACAHGLRQAIKESRLFCWLARRGTWRRPVLPDPGRFHFYQHVPPEGRRREAFDRAILRFERGAYRDPEWRSYRRIPVSLCWPPVARRIGVQSGPSAASGLYRSSSEPLAVTSMQRSCLSRRATPFVLRARRS